MDRKDIVKEIIEFFQSGGINPLFISLLILMVINFINIKKIKRWNEVPTFEKVYMMIGWIMTIVLLYGIIISSFIIND